MIDSTGVISLISHLEAGSEVVYYNNASDNFEMVPQEVRGMLDLDPYAETRAEEDSTYEPEQNGIEEAPDTPAGDDTIELSPAFSGSQNGSQNSQDSSHQTVTPLQEDEQTVTSASLHDRVYGTTYSSNTSGTSVQFYTLSDFEMDTAFLSEGAAALPAFAAHGVEAVSGFNFKKSSNFQLAASYQPFEAELTWNLAR